MPTSSQHAQIELSIARHWRVFLLVMTVACVFGVASPRVQAGQQGEATPSPTVAPAGTPTPTPEEDDDDGWFDRARDRGGDIVDGARDRGGDLIDDARDGAVDVATGTWDKIVEGSTAVWDFLAAAPGAIWNFMTGIPDMVVDGAKRVWRGVTGVWSNATDPTWWYRFRQEHPLLGWILSPFAWIAEAIDRLKDVELRRPQLPSPSIPDGWDPRDWPGDLADKGREALWGILRKVLFVLVGIPFIIYALRHLPSLWGVKNAVDDARASRAATARQGGDPEADPVRDERPTESVAIPENASATIRPAEQPVTAVPVEDVPIVDDDPRDDIVAGEPIDVAFKPVEAETGNEPVDTSAAATSRSAASRYRRRVRESARPRTSRPATSDGSE